MTTDYEPEIRVEPGISVVYLVVSILFGAFYLRSVLSPGYISGQLTTGAMFVS